MTVKKRLAGWILVLAWLPILLWWPPQKIERRFGPPPRIVLPILPAPPPFALPVERPADSRIPSPGSSGVWGVQTTMATRAWTRDSAQSTSEVWTIDTEIPVSKTISVAWADAAANVYLRVLNGALEIVAMDGEVVTAVKPDGEIIGDPVRGLRILRDAVSKGVK